MRRDHARNIAAQGGNLSHGGGREEGMILVGDEGDAFDIRCQAVVGQRHAKFEFEIRKDAQAAHDHLGIDLAAELHGHAAVTRDGDLGHAFESFGDQGRSVLPAGTSGS